MKHSGVLAMSALTVGMALATGCSSTHPDKQTVGAPAHSNAHIQKQFTLNSPSYSNSEVTEFTSDHHPGKLFLEVNRPSAIAIISIDVTASQNVKGSADNIHVRDQFEISSTNYTTPDVIEFTDDQIPGKSFFVVNRPDGIGITAVDTPAP